MLGKCPTNAPDITPLMGELCYTLTPEFHPQTRFQLIPTDWATKMLHYGNRETKLYEGVMKGREGF